MPTSIQIPVAAPVAGPRTQATAMSTYLPLLDGVFAPGDGPRRWLGGVSFSPFGCQELTGSSPEDYCDTDSITPLEDNVVLAQDDECVTFYPFVLDTRVTIPITSGPPEGEIQAYVQLHSLLSQTIIIGREAMTAGLTTNPSFVSEADTVVGVDDSAVGALAAVEDGLAEKLKGGVGMIHVTPGMLTILNSGGGLVFDGEDYRTATGHLIVADAGYTGGEPSSGTVTAGENWIYGTGPVFLKLDEPLEFSGPEVFNRLRNTVIYRIQQYALLMFEPCSVVAAMVDFAGGGGGIDGGGA